MNRVQITFLILMFGFVIKGKPNMSDPVHEGTLGARPFLNQYVEILNEDLYIKLDKYFESAYIKAVYHIKSQKDGIKIPLLFYASEYQEDFLVKVDGIIIDIKEIPYEIQITKGTKFDDFNYFFKDIESTEESEITIDVKTDDSSISGIIVNLNDMKYFETDISKGEHIIEVSYLAKNWTDGWDWVNEYSFRYALSPAKYWKSFGKLNITIDSQDFKENFMTNLGEPDSGSLENIAKWKFNNIPSDIIYITYSPKISFVSEILLFFRPLGASFLFGLLIVFLHYRVIRYFRKKQSTIKKTWLDVVGIFIAPALILFFWVKYIDWLKLSLGADSGMGINPYGLIIIPILFYPVILIIYWLIIWGIYKKLNKTWYNSVFILFGRPSVWKVRCK